MHLLPSTYDAVWVIGIYLRVILAEFFVLATFALSWVTVERLKPLPVYLRWFVWVVTAQVSMTVGFHLLLNLGWYNIPGAIGWSILCLAAAAILSPDRAKSLVALRRQPVLWWRWMRSSIRREKAYLLVLPQVIIQSAIVLVRPAMGYDYFVYHGMKAALWVTHGFPFVFNSPSGWTVYRDLPAGGSIALSWVMLLFHSDGFVAPVSWLYWPFFCLANYALARELGLNSRPAWLMAWFLSTTPGILYVKADGLIDVPMHAFLTGALALALRSFREFTPRYLVVIGAASGIAASMKIPSVPCAAILMASPVLLLPRVPVSRLLGRWLFGVFLCVALLVPWFYYSYRESGYPFSPQQVRIAGLTLGVAPPGLVWYMHAPLPDVSAFFRELKAASSIFFSKVPYTMDPYILLPLALAPLGFVKFLRQSWRGAVLLLLLVIFYLLFYASPSFEFVRISYANINGRFFLTAFSFGAILGYSAAPRFQPILGRLLFGVTIFELTLYATQNYHPFDVVLCPAYGLAPAALVLLVGASLAAYRLRIFRMHRVVASLCVVLPIWCVSVNVLANQMRDGFFIPYHDWFNRFGAAVMAVDNPPNSYRLDLTAGPFQLYGQIVQLPFMGRELQNEVMFVPYSRSGKSYDDSDPHRLDDADYSSWVKRLIDQKIDAVMTFSPRSVEMDWMEQHPEMFERIAGSTASVPDTQASFGINGHPPAVAAGWGLYRVIPVSRLPSSRRAPLAGARPAQP